MMLTILPATLSILIIALKIAMGVIICPLSAYTSTRLQITLDKKYANFQAFRVVILEPWYLSIMLEASDPNAPWIVPERYDIFPMYILILGVFMLLAYLGHSLAKMKPPYKNPVRTNIRPRKVPKQPWYMHDYLWWVKRN